MHQLRVSLHVHILINNRVYLSLLTLRVQCSLHHTKYEGGKEANQIGIVGPKCA